MLLAVKRLVRVARDSPRARASDVRAAMQAAVEQLLPGAAGSYHIAFADPLRDASDSSAAGDEGSSTSAAGPYATVIIVSALHLAMSV